MATIENVNDRTILQQFHSLYKAVEEIKNKGINLNVKGQYESETTYLKGDVVYNDGKAFYRINEDATTGIDTTDTEYWQMFFDAVSGLTGPRGPQGADGLGFNNATIIDILNDAVIVDNNGIGLNQTMRVTTEQQVGSLPPTSTIFDIETQSRLPIVGSESIIVDVAEDGEHAEIHLDAEITNKLARTLVTPLSTHRDTEIVAVDNTNSQTMLAIGDGLTIDNGTLKAVAGGSKLYRHHMFINGQYGMRGYTDYYCTNPNVFTIESLKTELVNKPITFNTNGGSDNVLYCSEELRVFGDNLQISAGTIKFTMSENNIAITRVSGTSQRNITSITDNVIEVL